MRVARKDISTHSAHLWKEMKDIDVNLLNAKIVPALLNRLQYIKNLLCLETDQTKC